MNKITVFSSKKHNYVFITTCAKWGSFSLERAKKEWNANFTKWKSPTQLHCKSKMIAMVNAEDFAMIVIGHVEADRKLQNAARNEAIAQYEAKGWHVLNY